MALLGPPATSLNFTPCSPTKDLKIPAACLSFSMMDELALSALAPQIDQSARLMSQSIRRPNVQDKLLTFKSCFVIHSRQLVLNQCCCSMLLHAWNFKSLQYWYSPHRNLLREINSVLSWNSDAISRNFYYINQEGSQQVVSEPSKATFTPSHSAPFHFLVSFSWLMASRKDDPSLFRWAKLLPWLASYSRIL